LSKFLTTTSPDFEADLAALLARKGSDANVAEAVRKIIAKVRQDGDAALTAYTKKFDRVTIDDFRVSADEIAAASASVTPELRDALALAARRIEAFHRRQLPRGFEYTDEAGVKLGLRWRALDAVGIYVPGATASYPSSVLMNALPAKVAGVERVAMCVPAPDGEINPLVLAAAALAGVTEIYQVGGAQAIAALAYGTETIAKVDRIVGPGNEYVAEAKRQVFGQVGIDSIAGPSEVLILADAANNPAHLALDLLAQAEHDEAAQAILITDDGTFAGAVLTAINEALPKLQRREIAAESWRRNGAVIMVRNWDEAVRLANRIAPEHVQIMTARGAELFAQIRHAGAVFLGANAPEAIGDYVAGPNHVLPTNGTARFGSGLSVLDFMKRTTWVAMSAKALQAIGPAAVALANAEGLGAHAASIAARLPEEPEA
jgi:histidinol dehydrogenase